MSGGLISAEQLETQLWDAAMTVGPGNPDRFDALIDTKNRLHAATEALLDVVVEARDLLDQNGPTT